MVKIKRRHVERVVRGDITDSPFNMSLLDLKVWGDSHEKQCGR